MGEHRGHGGRNHFSFQRADDREGTYNKGRIKLAWNYVGGDPSRNLVLPGMTVQADINTGEKTIPQYPLKPVYNALDSGFHER